MIYIYVYSVDGDKNAPDKKILDAYAKGNGVERYTLEGFINALNNDYVDLFNNWVKLINDPEGCYPISSLYINELEELGFNTQKVTESDLLKLADKLNDDYRELIYWNSLKIIADGLNFPRRKTTRKKSINAKTVSK